MGAILRARDKDGNVYDIPAIRGAQGPQGPQGPKGDTGSGFKVLDYYDSLEALEAAVTAPSAGDAYGVGTAAPYDIYIYGETSGWVNNGPIQGAQGPEGPAGADGVSPSVSVSDIAGGHRVSIQDAGGASNFDVMDGQNGSAGSDGITPTIGDNGNWYLGEADTGKPSRGETGPAGPQGETGQTGAAGHTPVRGTDYWTAEDQQDIVDTVLNELSSSGSTGYISKTEKGVAGGVATLGPDGLIPSDQVGMRIERVTYTGTGTAGTTVSYKTKIPFSFMPKVVIVYDLVNIGYAVLVFPDGVTNSLYGAATWVGNISSTISENIGITARIFYDVASVGSTHNVRIGTDLGDARYQFNKSDTEYTAIALG